MVISPGSSSYNTLELLKKAQGGSMSVQIAAAASICLLSTAI